VLSSENPTGIVPYRRELHRKGGHYLAHVDRIAGGVAVHQRGKRLLQRILGGGLLRLEIPLWDMLECEGPPADLLKDADNLQWTQRFGATQLKRRVPRSRMVEAQHGEARHIVAGDPADWIAACPIDRGSRVREVEAHNRAQPDLHKVARPQDGVGQTTLLQMLLDAALGVAKCEVALDGAGKGDIQILVDTGGLGSIHELELTSQIDGFDCITTLARDSGGRRRDHGVDALAGRIQGGAILQIAFDKLDADVPQIRHPRWVGGWAEKRPDGFSGGPQLAADLTTQTDWAVAPTTRFMGVPPLQRSSILIGEIDALSVHTWCVLSELHFGRNFRVHE
jgi:hypothetical protein